jgi:hypothetical protein
VLRHALAGKPSRVNRPDLDAVEVVYVRDDP